MIDSADSNEKSKNKSQSNNSTKTPVLDNFSRDLIKLAEEGKIFVPKFEEVRLGPCPKPPLKSFVILEV